MNCGMKPTTWKKLHPDDDADDEDDDDDDEGTKVEEVKLKQKPLYKVE